MNIQREQCRGQRVKIDVYKRQVLCYGCEAWAITQKTVDIVDTFERKILRRIIGPIHENLSLIHI